MWLIFSIDQRQIAVDVCGYETFEDIDKVLEI